MKRKVIQIITWLGIMAVLTLTALGIWMLIWGGQTTESLKWLQFLQTVGTFLLPPVLCACLWDAQHQPMAWLHLNQSVSGKTVLIAVVIMLCAIPGINLLADLNGRVELPESLGFIEKIFKDQEAAAAALTERFLKADNVGILLINIGLMALLPALAEELSFRGVLQQVLGNTHAAIWVTAFVFSAIHMQFYGFVPRMLLGAAFGYMFVWTGSLWVPMIMHFTNNLSAVLAYYFLGQSGENGINYADTIGAGTTWWLGLISLIVVGVLLWFTSPGQPGCVRRTHIQ